MYQEMLFSGPMKTAKVLAAASCDCWHSQMILHNIAVMEPVGFVAHQMAHAIADVEHNETDFLVCTVPENSQSAELEFVEQYAAAKIGCFCRLAVEFGKAAGSSDIAPSDNSLLSYPARLQQPLLGTDHAHFQKVQGQALVEPKRPCQMTENSETETLALQHRSAATCKHSHHLCCLVISVTKIVL